MGKEKSRRFAFFESRLWVLLKRGVKGGLLTLGSVFFIMIVLSFTEIPFWAYYSLGTKDSGLKGNPDYLVLLGNTGMPSSDGLIKTYRTAFLAQKYSEIPVIIALPADSALRQKKNLDAMKGELVMRGVDSTRIIYERNGTNTHNQAMNISRIITKPVDSCRVMIITTPEHLYRSILTFKKVGFADVGGSASFDKNLDPELLINTKTKQSSHLLHNLALRYNMWSYLKYEITVMREYAALLYYKLHNWI